VSALSAEAGWTDGFPVVEESDSTVRACLVHAGVSSDHAIGRGVSARDAAVHLIRAGGEPEYMPVVVAALEAVLDPDFHVEHLGGPLSTWPAFVVNGPIVNKLELYSGVYVMAAGRKANAAIGRAVSLVLGNCLPEIAGRDSAVLGSAARMAGMVIAEKEDSPWEPLHVMLGHPAGSSTVTAFSTSQGSPLQLLPLGTRFMSAPPIAALIAEHCSEGWCGRGVQMLLVSPNAQRNFLADGWSKSDLRAYLKEHARISVAQLKRFRRWKAGEDEQVLNDGSVALRPGDEERWLRLADDEIWRHLHPAPGAPSDQRQGQASGVNFDVYPVLAGSEVAHMYMHLFYPYPAPPVAPVTKAIRLPG
jgi:hypothetical protein